MVFQLSYFDAAGVLLVASFRAEKDTNIQITSESLHIRCVFMEVNKMERILDS